MAEDAWANVQRSVLTSEEWKSMYTVTHDNEHLEFQRACAMKIGHEPWRADVIMLLAAESFPPYGVDVEQLVHAYTPRVHTQLVCLIGRLKAHLENDNKYDDAPLRKVREIGDTLHTIGGRYAQVAVFNAILSFFPADRDSLYQAQHNRKNVRQELFEAWLGCGEWGNGFP
jgi:hypothetical protein